MSEHYSETVAAMLEKISGLKSTPDGAYNFRLDGKGEERKSSDHIKITAKTDKPGIDIRIADGTVNEKAFIPVVLTKSGLEDLVYNDFFIGENCDVTIIAGCGIHNCGCEDSKHNGIHTFYVGKNSKVSYVEVHYGAGNGTGGRILNPQTIVYLQEGATVVMDTSQIGGVDSTKRYTKVVAEGDNSEVMLTEKLMTHGDQTANSDVDIILNGHDTKARVISRSVAKENSRQVFHPNVEGNDLCFGHVQCDSIIMGNGRVQSIPAITANHVDASLIHEAAIGKIAGDQILKLEMLGFTAEEAEERILQGFLK